MNPRGTIAPPALPRSTWREKDAIAKWLDRYIELANKTDRSQAECAELDRMDAQVVEALLAYDPPWVRAVREEAS